MSDRKKLAVSLVVICILIFVLNYFTPLYADDYGYAFSFSSGERINNVLDIIPSMRAHYNMVNSRIITHSFAQLFLMMGKDVFSGINAFTFIVLLVLMSTLVGEKTTNYKYVVSAGILLFLFTPEFGQSFLWLTASTNYLYGPVIILIFLLFYNRALYTADNHNIVKSVPMLIFGFVAGSTTENGSATVIVCTLLYIILSKDKAIWMFTGLCGTILGALFLLSSPGEMARLDYFGGIHQLNIWDRFVYVTSCILEYFSLLIIALIAVLVFVLKKKGIKYIIDNAASTVIMMVGFFAGAYSMILSPIFPGRAWSMPVISLVTAVIGSVDLLYKSKLIAEYDQKNVALIKRSVLGVIGVCFIALYVLGSADVYRVYTEVKARNEQILKQKEEGAEIIVVNPVAGSTSYSCFDGQGDLDIDPDDWKNVGMARYYNVMKIKGVE